MYEANSKLIDDAKTLNNQVDHLTNLIASNKQRLNELATDIDAQRAKAEAAPTLPQINQLKETKADLDKKQADLEKQLIDAKAELDKLKQQAIAASAAANADPSANDAEIQQMNKDIAALTSRLADARKIGADTAAQGARPSTALTTISRNSSMPRKAWPRTTPSWRRISRLPRTSSRRSAKSPTSTSSTSSRITRR